MREERIKRAKELRAEALVTARAALQPRNAQEPKRKHRKRPVAAL